MENSEEEIPSINNQNKVCANCNNCNKPLQAGEHLYISKAKLHVCLACAVKEFM